jgi:putative FmdB family regulatory protein
MPTYEYACTKCGQHVEVFQRFSEPPLTTCGACGGPLRKVFHPAGIVFKGSGFYATDSRTRPKDGGESKPVTGTEQGSGSKTASGDGSSSTTGGSTATDKNAPAGSAKEKSA